MTITQINARRNRLIFLVFALFTIIFHLFGYIGHYGYDDMHYAELAHKLSQGEFVSGDHYSYRHTIIGLTALSYHLFGVNDFASSLPPLLIFISILFLIYKVLERERPEKLILSLSLCVFSEWFLFYSDKLMPDIYVAFAVMLAFYAIWKVRFRAPEKEIHLGSLLSFALIFGFLSKGSMILTMPAFIYFFITDIMLNRSRKFWLSAIISGILFTGLYLLIITLFTGDPLSRFKALEQNAYVSSCSYGLQPVSLVIERITYGFLHLLVNQGMLIALVFMLSFFMRRMKHDIWRLDTYFSFFLVGGLILLLSANFMSISLTSYNPMCLDTRHYLYLFPILSIPASRMIYHFSIRKFQSPAILILLGICLLTSELLPGGRHIEIYLLLFLLFTTKYFLPGVFKKSSHFILIFCLILLILPLQNMLYAHILKYKDQRTFIYSIIEENEKALFVTDDVQRRIAEYYMGFESTNENRFESFKAFQGKDLLKGNNYILLNNFTSYMGRTEIPFYVEIIKSEENLVKKDEFTGITLYRFPAMPKAESIFISENQFDETNSPFWSKAHIVEIIKADNTPSNCNYVPEFSSTFEYSFDSTYHAEQKSLILNLNFECLIKKQITPRLIVVFETEGSEYNRIERTFEQHIKSVDAWYDIHQEIFIPKSKIRANSKMSIYLWNPEKKDMYIDDFSVEMKYLLD